MGIQLLLVFIGGGLGSMSRFGLSVVMQPLTTRFPWATLAANGLACFILGWVTATQIYSVYPDQRRLLLITGFCGGFSTFSTFTNDTWQLILQGQYTPAALNVLLNLAICFLALILGLKIH
jgi:fluoride exporter